MTLPISASYKGENGAANGGGMNFTMFADDGDSSFSNRQSTCVFASFAHMAPL